MRTKISSLLVFCMVLQMLFFSMNGFAAPSGSDTQKSFNFMQGLGCVSGFPDGQSYLDYTMTRAEMVMMLVNCTGQGSTAKILAGASAFPDASQHWASGAIAVAKNAGWISGFPDGQFHPDEKVTYAQLLQMLDNVLGLPTISSLGWPERAVKAAVDAGIVQADADIIANADVYAPRGAVFFYSNSAFLNVPAANGKTVYQTYHNIPRPEPLPVPKPQAPPAVQPPAVDLPPAPVITNAVLTVAGDVYAQIKVTSVNANTLFYVVLPAGLAAPGSQQVLAGQDGAGQAVAAAKRGSISVTAADSTISLAQLNASTTYKVYVVGSANTGYFTSVRQVDLTTAPPLPLPTVTNAVYSLSSSGPFTVDVTVYFANASKLYYVVPDDLVPAPSANAVKSWSSDLRTYLAIGSPDVSGLQNKTFHFTVPDPATTYTVFIAVENSSGTSAVSRLDFVTP